MVGGRHKPPLGAWHPGQQPYLVLAIGKMGQATRTFEERLQQATFGPVIFIAIVRRSDRFFENAVPQPSGHRSPYPTGNRSGLRMQTIDEDVIAGVQRMMNDPPPRHPKFVGDLHAR